MGCSNKNVSEKQKFKLERVTRNPLEPMYERHVASILKIQKKRASKKCYIANRKVWHYHISTVHIFESII
jgi:hypothetical protein